MTLPDQRTRLQSLELNIAHVLQKQGFSRALKGTGRRIVGSAFRLIRGGWAVFWNRCGHFPIMHPIEQWARCIRRHGKVYADSAIEEVSSDYEVVEQSQLSSSLLRGWQAPSVADRQQAAYRSLLKRMYNGDARQDFVVAAQALRLTHLANPKVLEVGCGNGYYSEVLPHLSGRGIEYVGLDYSRSMIKSALENYPDRQFIVGDATLLPFADNSYDVVWSGTVLMHLVDYETAISETCRVSSRFCVFHSTPVVANGPTTFLRKKAYGTPVAEVIISQVEFEKLLHDRGLVLRHVLESLPYNVGGMFGGVVHTLTYVCEWRRIHEGAS